MDRICPMCSDQRVDFAGEVHGYRFDCCRRCGFSFSAALATGSASAGASLNRATKTREVSDVEWANPFFLKPALKQFAKRKPLRILDFGAGQSQLPHKLRQRGHKVTAVDLLPPLHPHPDRLTGDLRALHLEAGQFDFVYSFQVFEHLPDPKAELLELLRLTRPDGYVLIHTDMETPEREAGFSQWWYVLPPDHRSFFRHRTFRVFLEGRPDELVDVTPKSVLIRRKR